MKEGEAVRSGSFFDESQHSETNNELRKERAGEKKRKKTLVFSLGCFFCFGLEIVEIC